MKPQTVVVEGRQDPPRWDDADFKDYCQKHGRPDDDLWDLWARYLQVSAQTAKTTWEWSHSDSLDKWANELEERIKTAATVPVEQVRKDLDRFLSFWFWVESSKKQQRINITLLWLIFGCLVYINLLHPLFKQGISIVKSPAQAVQQIGQNLKNLLPKSQPVTGSVSLSGYWSGRAGRGDKFAGGRFTAGSPFGPRSSPGGIGSTNHQGQDIPADANTPLYIVGLKGERVQVECFYNGGGGNSARLKVPSLLKQNIVLGAAHMIRPCQSGTYTAGQVFGNVGSTGNSTGNHLHFAQKVNGGFVPPQRGFIEAMLSGKTLEGIK